VVGVNTGRADEPGVSGVILAGGHSRRMGMDKALLVWGGETFVSRTARVLGSVADDVTVTRRPEQLPLPHLRVVFDRWPDQGPLAGLEAGLLAARHEWVLAVPVDTPRLGAAVLACIARAARAEDEAEAVVPVWEGRWQPLVAAYRRSLAGRISAALDAGRLRVLDFVSQLSVRLLEEREWRAYDPGGSSFSPFHTPQDLHWCPGGGRET
jgi:molybdopterin-guanine dinucleotide biosynthesis protein A